MKKFFVTLAIMILTCSASFAQIKVTGKVTSADGSAVPFASVVVKGTMNGVASSDDGTYVLDKVPSNAKLVFSCIGYVDQEVAVSGRSKIDVILAADKEMIDETVVVAYGTAKKESVTGAIATVKSDAIAKRPVSSVTDVLEGQTSGIMVNSSYGEPGSDATIRIRGFGSVNGSNNPLYVIDGVPFGGNVSDLNPQDIESITVLKDATSAALYGNRASNGVIMITTKRGKTDKVTVTASVNQGIYMRGIPEYDKLTANDWMETYFEGYANYLTSSNAASYPTKDVAIAEARKNMVNDNLGYNIYNKPGDQLFDENGKIVKDASIRPGYTDLNWYDEVERIGHRQEYNISGQGASDKGNYYLSLAYLDEEGQIYNSDFNRWTGRANVNLYPKKWFKMGLNVAASMQESNGITTGTTTIANPLYFARVIAPIFPIYAHDENGEFILDGEGNKIFDEGAGRPQLAGRHVIYENQLDKRTTKRNTINAQTYADIKFLKDFTFTLKADVSLRESRYRSYSNAVIGDGKGNNGRASREQYDYMNYTFQQLLNYNHEFGDHTLELLAGHENYSYGYDYQYGYKTDQSFANEYEMDNFNSITSLDGSHSGYNLESYLARAKYDYLNKYFLEASFRRDGSSRFYADNQWGNFWSVGGTWIISKEDFMSNLSWVDLLKFRASYGQVGNDASAGYYAYMPLYSLHQYGNKPASYKIQNSAYGIQWESANTISTALEGRLFDRLNFCVEYFDKTTADLLFDVHKPLSAGGTDTGTAESVITENIGSVSNRGVEINFDVDIIKTKDFTWNVGGLATFMKNKVLVLPEENREDGILNGSKLIKEGHSIYAFYLYQFKGVDQMTGRALYEPDFEKYYHGEAGENEDRTVIPDEWYTEINGTPYVYNTTYARKDWAGDAIPFVYGSFNTALTYKNFTLSALFTYSLGGKLIDSSYMSLMSSTTTPSALHADLLKSWKAAPAGMTETSADRIDPNGTPSMDFYWSSYSNATSTRFLESSNYLVIKNVCLSYNLPSKFVQKLDLSRVTVNAAVDNLATFSAMKGLNPMQNFNGTVNNYFNTPRIVTVGLNVTL